MCLCRIKYLNYFERLKLVLVFNVGKLYIYINVITLNIYELNPTPSFIIHKEDYIDKQDKF